MLCTSKVHICTYTRNAPNSECFRPTKLYELNSKCVLLSDMHLITRKYGNYAYKYVRMHIHTCIIIGIEEMVVGNPNAGGYNGDGLNGGENEDETDSDNDENELNNQQNEDQNELDEGNGERNVPNIGIQNAHINEGKIFMEIFNLSCIVL